MRILIIVLIAMAGTLPKCNKGKVSATSGLIEKVSLSIHQYPMKEVLIYDTDSSSLRVRLLNNSLGVDSLLAERQVDLKGFQIYESDISKFDQELYANQCIQDGQVITLAFMKNDSTLRKVRFSNYYHEGLEKVINFINSNVDSVYSISYNRDQLIGEMKKCK
ncbi:hypothetical protein OCK74_20000 [Chitinophagaceae bacterium LB-8]|uniref:Uncharacterized protein n=1 Tax=Paraflavisolibacter caeni TaxID=2982496 RepID=A0A9X2XYV5_9BACT|nr:hypothetical protein [Paraflavisolibacter caeni]MCU7551416.1 hypothetical protein [Paraflavisolibacter caeni]